MIHRSLIVFAGLLQMLVVCAAALVAGPVFAADTVPWLHVDGRHIKDADGTVVVLSGVSIPDPEVINDHRWEQTAINVIDNAVQNFHSTVIRVPVLADPDSGEGTSGFFSDPDAYIETHLDPVVSRAIELGVYVIIDLHLVSDYSAAQRDDDVIPFWDRVASQYADIPNIIFEIYNEPINPDDWGTWLNTMAQPVVDHIRTLAPNNLIIVGGPRWTQNMSGAATRPVAGNNIVYAAHVYPEHPPESWDENFGAVAANHPLFVTEWGYVLGGSPPTDGTTSSFGIPFLQWMQEKGASWTAFAFDPKWGPPMFEGGWRPNGGEEGMGEFVRSALTDYVWVQPPGTAYGTPNWLNIIGNVYDGDIDTWCQMDENEMNGVDRHPIFPYAHFGVAFAQPVYLDGVRFRNNLGYWNHIEEYEVWALPEGKNDEQENWELVVRERSSLMQYGWVEAIFENGPLWADQIHVRYLKITGGYAAPVGEIEFAQADADGDQVTDIDDNCTEVANGDQLDTDGDGYGQLCDGDFNNDGSTNTLDLHIFKAAHNSCSGDVDFDRDADFNGDGCVNTLDLNILKGLYRKPPGPSCCGV